MENLPIMKRIIANVEKVIIGKRESVQLVLMSLVCGGHVLIEDVPGVGKTSLVSALARSIQCSFKRIQFTPDIMPSDITGFSVYNPKTDNFEYRPGAVFAQFVLADEINRTSPKTQSSLLEVMEEGQVTVDGTTYQVPMPFMVLATQNPVEYLGTYPLPEAQLDRFFMKIRMGYPNKDEESEILNRFKYGDALDALTPIATAEEVMGLREAVRKIHVSMELHQYIVNLVDMTRNMPDLVALGASPRGSLCLMQAAQSWALYNSRDYVIPDDIIYMAPHILTHRLILKQEARFKNIDGKGIIEHVLESVTMPRV